MDLANRRPAMPWREVSVMEQRREFVRLAMQEGANRRELCRRFGIHPQTGYKWLARWQANQDVSDQSRRPRSSPRQTEGAIEQRVIAVRDAHPAWGARKIALPEARGRQPAGGLHGASDPAPVGSYQGAIGRRGGKPALRDAGTEPVVADGLQGLDPARQRSAMPSLDGGGRSFAL